MPKPENLKAKKPKNLKVKNDKDLHNTNFRLSDF